MNIHNMEDELFKTVAILIILYAVFHLIRLIRNIIEAGKKSDKNEPPKHR